MLVMYYFQQQAVRFQEIHSKNMKIEKTRNSVDKDVRRAIKLADLLKKK